MTLIRTLILTLTLPTQLTPTLNDFFAAFAQKVRLSQPEINMLQMTLAFNDMI